MKQLTFEDLYDSFNKEMSKILIRFDANNECFVFEMVNMESGVTLLRTLQRNPYYKDLKDLIVIKSKKEGYIWPRNYNQVKKHLYAIRNSRDAYALEYLGEANNYTVIDKPEDFFIEYSFDNNDRCLHKRMPEGVEQISKHIYKRNDEIWLMPKLDCKLNNEIHEEKIEYKDIITFLTIDVPNMVTQGYPIITDRATCQVPVVISVTEGSIYGTSQIKSGIPLDELNQETVLSVANNEEYHMYQGLIYKVTNKEKLLALIEKYNNRELLREEYIVEFICDTHDYKSYYDDSAREIVKKYRIVEKKDISLRIKSTPNIKDGIGDTKASVVVEIGNITLDAKKLSPLTNKAKEYIRLGNMIIMTKHLREIGIGKCGRFSDGSLIKDIKMKKEDILYGTYNKLFNQENHIMFQDDWLDEGKEQDIAMNHFKFLLNYGISGGLSGVKKDIDEEMLPRFVKHMFYNNPNVRMVILTDTKSIKELKDDFLRNSDIVKIIQDKNLNEISDISDYNIIITSYISKECIDKIEMQKWDMLLLDRIDSHIRSTKSKLFMQLYKGIKAKIKFGLIERNQNMLSSSAGMAYFKIFGLNYYTDSFLLRNINRKIELPREQKDRIIRSDTDNLYEIVLDGEKDASEKINAEYSNITVVDDNDLNFEFDRYDYVRIFTAENFIKLAKKHKNTRVESANRVNFDSIRKPCLSSFNDKQLKWYIYVREKLKNGIFLDIEPACIEVLFYEILNGFIYKNPEDNLYLMNSIIDNYGLSSGKNITRYRTWMFEYAVINNLKQDRYSLGSYLKNWYEEEDYVNYKLNKKLHKDNLVLTSKELNLLLNLYEGDCEDYIDIIKGIITDIDKYNRDNYNQGVLEMFRPFKLRKYYFKCFEGAIVKESNCFCITDFPFVTHEPLREFISEIVKYAVQQLNKKKGIDKKYTIKNLEDEYKDLIDDILEIPIKDRKRKRTIKKDRPEETVDIKELRMVTVDETVLETNRKAAKVITDMLVVEGSFEEVSDNKDKSIKKKAPKKKETIKKKEVAKELDNEESIFISNLSSEHKKIIKSLIKKPNKADELYKINKMPDVLIDEINELFMEAMGDLLISDYCIASEYLYIFS